MTGAGRATGAGGGTFQPVMFRMGAGSTARVAVSVTDGDGLSASDSVNVAVSVREAPPGTSPF